jgi:hypothetical protein
MTPAECAYLEKMVVKGFWDAMADCQVFSEGIPDFIGSIEAEVYLDNKELGLAIEIKVTRNKGEK